MPKMIEAKVCSGKQGTPNYVEVTIQHEQYESISDATSHLGEEKVLELINLQWGTICKNAERKKYNVQWSKAKVREEAETLYAMDLDAQDRCAQKLRAVLSDPGLDKEAQRKAVLAVREDILNEKIEIVKAECRAKKIRVAGDEDDDDNA